MKKIILFDIDKTLIDTDRLSANFAGILHKKCGISVDKYLKAKSEYKNKLTSPTDFNPKEFCRFLSQRFSVEYDLLIPSYYKNASAYQNVLFPEVVSTLKVLSIKYTLGIFSEGFKGFQTAKLKFTDLLKYFNKRYIFILRRKTKPGSLRKLPKDTTIVDDKPEVIMLLTKYSHIIPIYLNRNHLKNDLKTKTLDSLSDLK